jgi:haloalkane dehalogenase
VEVERTPDVAFEHLPGYPFAPRHLEIGGAGGLRMHYVDEGVREHPVVLLVHGLPAWSYLYRSVIPILVEAGCRAVAPDLIGCGRSDKPVAAAAHGYAAHLEWLSALLAALDLRDVTLVCEDVGALFGLRLVVDQPERFGRVVALDPCLPGDAPPPPAFARWIDLAARGAPPPAPSALVRELSATPLSTQAAAAYDAPFSGATAAVFAGLGAMLAAPAVGEASRLVLARLARYLGPLVVARSEPDAASRAAAEEIAAAAPGARWLEGAPIEAGARLIAEDRGPELAAAVLELIRGG